MTKRDLGPGNGGKPPISSAAPTQTSASSPPSCASDQALQPSSTAVQFADLNGDGAYSPTATRKLNDLVTDCGNLGRAEYLYVGGDGSVTAYLNLGGPDNGPNAAKVGWLPQGQIAGGRGAANRSTVAFADLNGDGRAEYLVIHPDGSVEAWLNLGGPDNGPNAAKVSWLPQGIITSVSHLESPLPHGCSPNEEQHILQLEASWKQQHDS